MKEFLVQVEVYVSVADDAGRSAYHSLEQYGEGLENFSTISRASDGGLLWVFAYDCPDTPLLDDLVLRMIDELPSIDEILKLRSVTSVVVSIGVMSDLYATSIDLAPATLCALTCKLKGAGLQIMHYRTEFDRDSDASSND